MRKPSDNLRAIALLILATAPIAFCLQGLLAQQPAIFGWTLGLLAEPSGRAVQLALIVGALFAACGNGARTLLAPAFILASYVVFEVDVTRRRGLALALCATATFYAARCLAGRLRGGGRRLAAACVIACLGFAALYAQGSLARRPIRRTLPALADTALADTALAASARSIILITLDTTRADTLGCYGNTRPITPHIDAFAETAVLFTNATATAPHTHPSMASLLTSLAPLEHGSISGSPRLNPDTLMLAEHCRAQGYATAGFLDNPWLVPAFGLTRGYEHLSPHVDLVEIERWLDAQSGGPTFLHVHLFTPHGPYELRPHSLEAIGGSDFASAEERIGPTISAGTIRGGEVPTHHNFSDVDIGWMHDVHTSEVHVMDAWLGTFFAALDARGKLDTAVIAIASDHGEEFGERGGLHHSHTLFPELLHVPLLIRAPDLAPHVEARPTSLLDVAPTLLQLAGAAPLPGATGTDRSSGQQGEDRLILSTRFRQAGRHFLRATDGNYALHVRVTPGANTQSQALFDLTADPNELHDIASANRSIVESMLAREQIKSALEQLRSLAVRATHSAAAPPRVRARLESLGYSR